MTKTKFDQFVKAVQAQDARIDEEAIDEWAYANAWDVDACVRALSPTLKFTVEWCPRMRGNSYALHRERFETREQADARYQELQQDAAVRATWLRMTEVV